MHFLSEQWKSPCLLRLVGDRGMELSDACVMWRKRFLGCLYASMVLQFPNTVRILSVLGRWKIELIYSTVFLLLMYVVMKMSLLLEMSFGDGGGAGPSNLALWIFLFMISSG